MSGIVPGVLTGLVLMGYCFFYSRRRGWRGEQKKRTVGTLSRAAWEAKWALMVPVIVLGGIYGGVMTPTEAAAIAAFYGLIVGVFLYREMNCRAVARACEEACETSSVIIVLMAMATLFGNIMTLEDVPRHHRPRHPELHGKQDRHPAAHQRAVAHRGHLHGSPGRHRDPYAYSSAGGHGRGRVSPAFRRDHCDQPGHRALSPRRWA